MPNYQNGKIYKIESPQTDQIYIGSTTQKLCDRMTNHRSDFKCRKGNCTSFKILEYGDAKIYLIELFPCNSKEELEAREGYWQKEMRGKGLLINKLTAGKCDKKEYNKNWSISNSDKMNVSREKWSKKMVKCNICDIMMKQGSISRHKKLKHKPISSV